MSGCANNILKKTLGLGCIKARQIWKWRTDEYFKHRDICPSAVFVFFPRSHVLLNLLEESIFLTKQSITQEEFNELFAKLLTCTVCQRSNFS